MKKLIPALCMLLIAAAMLGTSTYAWFSMNTTVTATGMSVKATTAASLVIGTNATVGTDVTVTVTDTTTKTLFPSTYDATVGTTAELKYVTNSENIDASTGLKSADGETLTYADAANSDGKLYYVDYVVYVAASGEAITDKTIQATLLPGSITAGYDTLNAISVAFYVGDATARAAAQNVAHAATSVKLSNSAMNIPVNTTGSLKITMRVYLDGALEKASGQAYVYNDKIDVNALSLGVQFDLVDPS